MNLKNNLLVSLPNLTPGTAFHKSVVYINTHHGDGASGWVVNKQLEDEVDAKLRRGMKLTKDIPIYYGGPVNVNSAVILHSPDFNVPATTKINDTLSITKDKSIINIMNMGQFPEYYRIIVGSTGWGPSQLESEILGSRTAGSSSWVSTAYSDILIWQTDTNIMWEKGIETHASEMTNSVLNF